MDTEEEIHKMADKLAKDQGWSKIKALSVLQSRYQSERRLEEAAIVQRIIAQEEEESKSEKDNRGFYEES
jgi:hypothetical protein